MSRYAVWGILRKFVRNLQHDWIAGRAAQMAFFFMLSAFPLLLLMMAALSHFPDAQLMLRDALVQHLAPLLPPSMLALIFALLEHLAEHPTGLLASSGAVALWAASSGMVATVDGLNQAYGIRERRSWWMRRLVGLVLTLVIMFMIVAAVVLLAVGAPLAETLAKRMNIGAMALLAWRVLQWPAIFCCTLLAFDLVYRFGPHRRRTAWHWFPIEALVAISLWLAASIGLRAYMIRFGNYSVIYGAMGGMIVLSLWFYMSAIAILTSPRYFVVTDN
ncbi:MAG: YihY/virulence factor BrkB family protein [Pseudomonadota bacterium]